MIMQGCVIECGAVLFFQKSRNLSRSLLTNNNFYCAKERKIYKLVSGTLLSIIFSFDFASFAHKCNIYEGQNCNYACHRVHYVIYDIGHSYLAQIQIQAHLGFSQSFSALKQFGCARAQPKNLRSNSCSRSIFSI